MFDFNQEAQKNEAKRAAEKELSKMISQMLLESDAPENVKTSVRLLNAIECVNDAIKNVLTHEVLTSNDIDIENANKVVYFLTTMAVQFEEFAKHTPLIKREDSENA